MYWCKPLIYISSLCLIVVAACKPDIKETKAQYNYFDLKGFMHKDSAKLVVADPWVNKTVSHNGEQEIRKIKINNWGYELSLFTSSDINRPAWRVSYAVVTKGDSTVYTAKEPDLKTQRLIIVKTGNKIGAINIVNHVKNLLFEANENLTYIPDSIYIIDKRQHILLLGNNNYLITGKLVK